jgi:histidyl-tRNA synthetase
VWRADQPQQGRFREFYQCDVDVIGEGGRLPECEVILATVEALRTVGLEEHFVKISDRRLLPAVFTHMGLSDQEIRKALISVDKLDKIGVAGVLAESEGYLPAEKRNEVRRFLSDLTARESPEMELSVLGEWGQRCAEALEPLLAGLRILCRTVEEAGDVPVPFRFWPSLVRGMGYYTGPIFEIWDRKHPFSLAGGGRYDGLIGVFLGEEVPACGFSIGFERILTVMKKQGTSPLRKTRSQTLVALRREDLEGAGLRLAGQLRRAGIATEVYPFTSRMKKPFQQAEELGIPWVILLGGPEDQELELVNMGDRSRTRGSWQTTIATLREKTAS